MQKHTHKSHKCAARTREPALKVILANSGVVQGAGHDVDHVVWEAQGLVELLRSGDHLLLHALGGL